MNRSGSNQKPIVAHKNPTREATGCKHLAPLIRIENQADSILFPGNKRTYRDIHSTWDHNDFAAALRRELKLILPAHHASLDKSPKWGTLARVCSVHRQPTGGFAVELEGLERVRVTSIRETASTETKEAPEPTMPPSGPRSRYLARYEVCPQRQARRTSAFLSTVQFLKHQILECASKQASITAEALECLLQTQEAGALCDLIAPHLMLSHEERFQLFRTTSVRTRTDVTLGFLHRELQTRGAAESLRAKVTEELSAEDHRKLLKRQIAALKKELGEDTSPSEEEYDRLVEALEELELPDHVRDLAQSELERLQMTAPGTPDYQVSHNFLCWIRDLPWEDSEGEEGEGDEELSQDDHEPALAAQLLAQAKRSLDKQHFGLSAVKNRILEHLAVTYHVGQQGPGQILLLHGPPGVGKSSLAASIADALGKPLCRVPLGSVRDEAEIRGHRRTYVGALPGKIIQAMKSAGCTDPVLLLDEIDKQRGEGPSPIEGALLELLDREQNKAFTDHFLGFAYDLSKVTFIATANQLDDISAPLRDRMEAVELPSYTDEEKVAIARNHLIKRVRKQLSLNSKDFRLSPTVVQHLCRFYARESGVRQLERDLTTIGRKIVRKKIEDPTTLSPISTTNIQTYLGRPRYQEEPRDLKLAPGVAIGLAYTSVGGDILYIETTRTPSDRSDVKLRLTGQLGKVMQESARTALTYLTAHAEDIGLDSLSFSRSTIHLHLPDGSTPKDGPSAGVAILSAFMGLMTGRALPSHVAMTGEITLRGQVLAVGGIREKVLAAHRYGKRTLILPRSNLRDLEDVHPTVIKDMQVIAVDTMEDVMQQVTTLSEARQPAKTSPLGNLTDSSRLTRTWNKKRAPAPLKRAKR